VIFRLQQDLKIQQSFSKLFKNKNIKETCQVCECLTSNHAR